MELRPYQKEAINSLSSYEGEFPLLVLSTGAGKSFVIAEICRLNKDLKILNLTHRKELIKQNREEYELISGDKAGVFSSGLKERDISKRVTFAGVQTIVNHLEKVNDIDMVIIDECHLVPKSSDTQYGKVIRHIYNQNFDVQVLGLTATPYRLDSGLLYGEDMLFDGIAYETDVYDLIQDGYLCDIKSKRGGKKIDLSKVKKKAGEFNSRDLERSASEKDCLDSVVSEVIEYLKERNSCIVFSSGIKHSELLKETFNQYGLYDCDYIASGMSDKDRDAIIDKFKSGEYRVIINTNILTTGFNHKPIDIVCIARATLSASLYVQMVGRGMRIHEGKKDCLILDYGDNVIRHGVINDIQVEKKSSSEKENRESKECPHCSYIIPKDSEICKYCGEVPIKEQKFKIRHGSDSFDGDMLSNPNAKIWLDVSFMYPPKITKTKKGKPCLILSYKIEGRTKSISKYILAEHSVSERFTKHWLYSNYKIFHRREISHHSLHALAQQIQLKGTPKKIQVKKLQSKFPEIIKMEF